MLLQCILTSSWIYWLDCAVLCSVTQSCLTLCDPHVLQPAMLPYPQGFSRQEQWSGQPIPSPGDLPDLGIEPGSPALQADSLPAELPGQSTGQIASPLSGRWHSFPWNLGVCSYLASAVVTLRSHWSRASCSALTGVLTRRGNLGTNPWGVPSLSEDKGRDWSDGSTRQEHCGHPSATRSWKRLGRSPLEPPQGGHGPVDTIISDCQTPELRDNKFLVFQTTQFVVLCDNNPSKLQCWVISKLLTSSKTQSASLREYKIKCKFTNYSDCPPTLWNQSWVYIILINAVRLLFKPYVPKKEASFCINNT